MITLGPPVSDSIYLEVLQLLGVERSLTKYPSTAIIRYQDMDLFLTRIEEERLHNLNEILSIVNRLSFVDRLSFPARSRLEEIYFIDNVNGSALMNSEAVWEGLSSGICKTKRQHV